MSFFSYKDYYDHVSSKQFHTYVEVGCFEGDSITYLANTLRPKWRQVKIFAVDVFDTITKDIDPIFAKHGQYWERYEEQLIKEDVRRKVTDIKRLSHEGADFFKDRSVDFVFLDASKTYYNVMRDMDSWWPKVSGYGILAGHDCFMPSVHRAVQEFCDREGKKFKIYPGSAVWEIRR
jgi:predicted O-methyltransferase YrrM